MTVREAEHAADAVLQGFRGEPGGQVTLPVDPFEVARDLGIAVRMVAMPADQSGRIEIPATGNAVIYVNAADHPNRQRFTCAHEIGHYIRRQHEGSIGVTFVDYRDTLAGAGVDATEIYANQFGAALLMPAALVQQHFRQDQDLERLARKFGTSTQAMSVRLRNLRLA